MKVIFLYSLTVVALACAGAAIPFFFKRKKKDKGVLRFFISFGAGVLLGAAFLHMIPHAAELAGSSVGFYILLGFLFLYLLESFTFSHSCEEHDCDYHTLGLVAAGGLSIHNFVNGVALGSAAQLPVLGFWVFVATAAHKGPEFFSLSSILLAGRRKKGTVLLAALAVASMILLGALLSGVLLKGGNSRWLGAALGFSAGTFIHLAATDLAPEVHHIRQARWAHLAAFLGGLAVMWLSAQFEIHAGAV
jgi:zinc transporter ZupT